MRARGLAGGAVMLLVALSRGLLGGVAAGLGRGLGTGTRGALLEAG